MNLKRNDIPCDLRALFAGISDFMTNAKPKFTDEQLNATMERFAGEMEQRFRARIERNKQQEADFLAQNKTQPGVQVTPSGLQYKVVQVGNGPSPTLTDTVSCHYRGQLLDGTEFDNSGDSPAEFRVDGVIRGWTEALQKMKVGDKWEVYVPSALAYGMEPDPNSGIEPASMLVFEIELLGIAPK
jgi:FKBP-type peptidyl-prolyl cis-trans isomerase